MSFAQIEKTLKWSALVVLVVGLGSSILTWRAQDRIERENQGAPRSDPDGLLSPLEMTGRKAGPAGFLNRAP